MLQRRASISFFWLGARPLNVGACVPASCLRAERASLPGKTRFCETEEPSSAGYAPTSPASSSSRSTTAVAVETCKQLHASVRGCCWICGSAYLADDWAAEDERQIRDCLGLIGDNVLAELSPSQTNSAEHKQLSAAQANTDEHGA